MVGTWPAPTPPRCGAPSRSRAGRPCACAWPGRPTAPLVIALLERRGLPADELDVRRLLAFDPARRHVLCALAPLDGSEVLAGIGAIDFGADAPDVLVIDERFAPGLGERARPRAGRALALPPRPALASPGCSSRPAPPRPASGSARSRQATRRGRARRRRPRRRGAAAVGRGARRRAGALRAPGGAADARRARRARAAARARDRPPAHGGGARRAAARRRRAERPRRRRARPRWPTAGSGAPRCCGPAGAPSACSSRAAWSACSASADLAVDGARAGGGRLAAGRQRRRARPRRAAGRRAAARARSCAPGSRTSCWPSCTATRRGRRCRTRARGSSRSTGRRPRARCSCSRARRSSRSPRPRCGPRSPRAGAIRPPPGASSACRRSPSRCSALLRERALRLEVGDPASEQAEVGPLRSPEDLAALEALVEEAVAGGAELICGGPVSVEGLSGAVLRARRAAARARRRADPARARAGPGARGRRGRRARPPRSRWCRTGPTTGDRRARGGVVSVWAARPREGRARRPHARGRADLGQRARRRRAGPGAPAAAPRRRAPGRLPDGRDRRQRAACPTTRPSFGPEPPSRGWSTAARRTA